MHRPTNLIPALGIALLALLASGRPAGAVWNATGNAVATASGISEELQSSTGANNTMSICSDMRGGVIVAWQRSTDDSIMVQRLNHLGARSWNGATGRLVNDPTVPPNALTPVVVSDEDGGAWVVWRQTDGVWAQRFDMTGVAQLPAGGVRVTGDHLPPNFMPPCDATAGGKLLIAWCKAATGQDSIKVQRVSKTGGLDWPDNGVCLQFGEFGIGLPVWSVIDDANGAVVLWESSGSAPGVGSFDNLHANRVSSAGVPQWGPGGVVVYGGAIGTTLENLTTFRVDDISAFWNPTTGLYVAFSRVRTGGLVMADGVSAQRMDLAGNERWGSENQPPLIGITAVSLFRTVGIASDGGTGCIIGVSSNSSNPDIRAQRLNVSGTPQWGATGVSIDAAALDQDQLRVVPGGSNGADGAYFIYRDESPGNGQPTPEDDVVVKKVLLDGSVDWTAVGRTTSDHGLEDNPVACIDGAGGVLIAWEDDRDTGANSVDVYSKHLDANGTLFVGQLTLIAPNGGEFSGTFFPVPITWTSNYGGKVQIDYRVGAGALVPISLSTANDGALTWYVPILDANDVKVRVAIDNEPTVFDETAGLIDICPVVTTPSTIAGMNGARDVAAGDFNEDGYPDLLVAADQGVWYLRKLSAGGFAAPVLFSTPSAAQQLVVGDWDEDGDLDYAVTHAFGVERRLGTGTGSFGSAGIVGSGLTACTGIAAGDLDQDGIPDLVVAENSTAQLHVFRGLGLNGDGGGSFTPSVTLTTGASPQGVAVADLNNDGILDLVVCNEGADNVRVWRQSGAQGAGLLAFTLVGDKATGSNPRAVVAHSFDADADRELAVATDLGVTVWNNGLITPGAAPIFEARTDYATLVGGLYDIQVADFSRNGIEDLVVTSLFGGGVVEALLGNGSSTVGDGTFTVGGVLASGGFPIGATVMDLDRDGRPDIAVANSSSDNVAIFLGGCTSSVSVRPTVTAPVAGSAFIPGQLRTISWTKSTNVATVDVEVTHDDGVSWERIGTQEPGTSMTWRVTDPTTASSRVRVFPHLQPQVADSSDVFTICSPLPTSSNITVGAIGPMDGAAADFNGDGILDLVQTRFDGTFSYKRGLGAGGVGNGTFAADTAYANTANLTDMPIAVVDWNEDGAPDVVVGRTDGFSTWRDQLTASGPSGRFVPGTALTSALIQPTQILTADVNEDGHQDLILVQSGLGNVLRVFGTGSGFGGSIATISSFTGVTRATTGDFNEDGILDIAVGCNNAGSTGVRVLLGLGSGGVGNGAFAPSILYPTAASVLDVMAGDFDKDGILDLVASEGVSVGVLRGLGAGGVGNGTFATESTFPAQGTIGRMATADLDRDGFLDLLFCSGLGLGAVDVFDGLGLVVPTGGPGFAAPTRLGSGGSEVIVLADVNEDGLVDALLAQQVSGRWLSMRGGCGTDTPQLTLTAPNAFQLAIIGTTLNVTWTKSPSVGLVHVELSRDNGATWLRLVSNLEGTSFLWNVVGPTASACRIRVIEATRQNVVDASDQAFAIVTTSVDAPSPVLPRMLSLSIPTPNPSRDVVSMVLTLPTDSEVAVDLFDITGRHVRSLASGAHAAGEHRLVWDGRDNDGMNAGAGVYFARARIGGQALKRTLVRVE